MGTRNFDFNLLVSCPWGVYKDARREIQDVLARFGDDDAQVERSVAEGIVYVKTCLDVRKVIRRLRELFFEDPLTLQYTLKYVPVDLWTFSDIGSMKEGVRMLKDKIHKGEKWRMTVKKHRYTKHHKVDIIRKLADLIYEKVDLTSPDKIFHVDIIGRYAALSVLIPQDIFSVAKPLVS